MPRLTDTEKRQLTLAAKKPAAKPPPPPLLSPRGYIEFATFAARFSRASKPVRFVRDNWKR